MLASPNVSSVSARTAHTVFWRGIQENISLKTDTSDPFSWRRIVVELAPPPVSRPATLSEAGVQYGVVDRRRISVQGCQY